MGENTHQNCTRQNKNKEDPGRQQPCWGFLFCTNLTQPTGALDSRNAKALMEKLAGLNRDEKATVLMVTHDSNAASYCKRILFIQDGVIFHELRRDLLAETQQQFYERILQVMAQLGGGSANVL